MNKIKLNKLAQNAMKEKEMNHVRGGRLVCCTCGCNGPSATDTNGYANSGSGLNSPGGGKQYCTVIVEYN
jgi:natural product precursor